MKQSTKMASNSTSQKKKLTGTVGCGIITSKGWKHQVVTFF